MASDDRKAELMARIEREDDLIRETLGRPHFRPLPRGEAVRVEQLYPPRVPVGNRSTPQCLL